MLNNITTLSSLRNAPYGAIATISGRFYSQEIKTFDRVDTASLKRGTGGRSSFNGNVVTVFGATGFLGRYIVNELGKRGSQIIIPYRCDVDDPSLKSRKLAGDLGQVLFQPFHLKDPVSIQKSIKYSNMVINLIGKSYETSNFDFYDVHFKGARDIAQACRDMNVDRLIHFSTLNVDQPVRRYVFTKHRMNEFKLKGEEAVLEEFPNATIFRPSLVFGRGDHFMHGMLSAQRRPIGKIPLYAKGLKTYKYPVYAGDIAVGVINALNDRDTRGKIYQAIGPQKFLLHDIAKYCAELMQAPYEDKLTSFGPNLTTLLFLVFRVLFAAHNTVYYHKMEGLSLENIEMESVSDVVHDHLPVLKDLGVTLTKFEEKLPNLIYGTYMVTKELDKRMENLNPVMNLSSKEIKKYSF